MNEALGVSIIVLNYNYGRFLAEAIESALKQNHPLCEVIVVDDASTDHSRDVIARYGDESDLYSEKRMTVKSLHWKTPGRLRGIPS